MNGQDGAIGEVGSEDASGEERGEEGQLGERGLVEVKNSWTLWCWRTWKGRAVRHLSGTTERKGNEEVGSRLKTKGIDALLSDLNKRIYLTAIGRNFNIKSIFVQTDLTFLI